MLLREILNTANALIITAKTAIDEGNIILCKLQILRLRTLLNKQFVYKSAELPAESSNKPKSGAIKLLAKPEKQ